MSEKFNLEGLGLPSQLVKAKTIDDLKEYLAFDYIDKEKNSRQCANKKDELLNFLRDLKYVIDQYIKTLL